VPARNFRKAVHRNRVKRLVREAWRLEKNALREQLLLRQLSLNVFFIYTGRELPEFSVIRERVQAAIVKLIEVTNEKVSSNP